MSKYKNLFRESVPESVSNRSNKAFQSFQKTVPESIPTRSETAKAARNAQKITTRIPVKSVGCVSAFLCSIYGTIARINVSDQIALYLGAVAVNVALDPLELFVRIWAKQTRYLIAGCCALIIMAIYTPDPMVWVVVGGVSIACLLLCKILNSRWILSENWLMSKEVERSLLWDVENDATDAWQAHGRREARTLLHELGYNADSNMLDGWAKPLYVCGFLHGKRKVSVSEIESLQNQAKDAKQDLKTISKVKKALEQENRELRERLKDVESTKDYYQKEYIAEHKRCLQLERANEELIADLSDLEKSGEQQTNVINVVPVESKDDKVMRLLSEGKSLGETAKIMGISKSSVYRIKEKYRKVS